MSDFTKRNIVLVAKKILSLASSLGICIGGTAAQNMIVAAADQSVSVKTLDDSSVKEDQASEKTETATTASTEKKTGQKATQNAKTNQNKKGNAKTEKSTSKDKKTSAKKSKNKKDTKETSDDDEDGSQYQKVPKYVAENIDENIVTDVEGDSAKKIEKNLNETGHFIRLKHLIAEKSKIPANCSIDKMWAKYSDAFVSQYTDTVPLYETSDDADYYIANLAVSDVNGTGDIYDAAFIKGTNNANPDVIKNIKFDKKSGLAYVPKSYFKEKDPLITGQVMYAGSINNQTTNIDVTIQNPNDESQSVKKTVKGSTYDVTVKIPITDSADIAGRLSLNDFKVYLNDSETEYDLTAKDAAVYNASAGELELGVSPAALTSVKVEIKKEKLTESILRLFTKKADAKITNPDKLKFVTDKKTGDPIVLDRIDTSKLQDGQVFEYKASVRYFSDLDDMETNYNNKASAEAIRHSIKYLYIPTGNAESGWFDVYDKGSDFDDTDGVNLKTNFEDVTFGMSLPSYSYSEYKATALNKNKATLNFHQKGQFVTKYTDEDQATYPSRHMYAGECAHITNPMGSFNPGEAGKVRLSILHVDTDEGYVIIGLNSKEVNTQSGFGIYKLAIESKGAVKVKKTSANTSITNGNKCYSLEGAEFGVYSDSACTKKVMTLAAKANGETDVKEIDAGTYYVKGAKRFLINAKA